MFPHTGQCYAVSVRGGLERPAFISSRCEVDQLLDSSVELAATIGHGTFYREQAPIWEPTPAEERLREANGDGETPRTPYAALQEALRRLGCLEARIAVDEDGVSREFFDAAADLMPKAEFVPGADLLRKVRQVKTPQELERLRRSAQVAERGIAAALAEVREGVTEQDLVRLVRRGLCRRRLLGRHRSDIRLGRAVCETGALLQRDAGRRGGRVEGRPTGNDRCGIV